ncbi:MAG TPA: glycosyltransferase family 4 protein, partial [Gaiellaceae bacterium]|nr:glycosyltransferase family 4 protein [Gaiellaceae bacterium]
AGTILEQATSLVVHSRFVEERAREARYAGPIRVIPHPAWPAPDPVPAEGILGRPLIGCFGNLNMNKRIPQLLEAFTLFRGAHPDARLLLVGASAERFDLSRRLERLALADGVIREDYVDEARMWSLMARCDVLVNLRYPTMGETSGSVIRGLSLGKPMVVSEVGWFAELPDDVALKVPVDEYEVPTLAAALELVTQCHEQLGERALEYVRTEHDLGRAADAYAAVVEVAAGGAAVSEGVLREVARAAAEVGIEDPSALARRAVESGIVT